MSVTSDFYLARVAQCAREAGETDLANVRDRCLRAKAAWQAMADRVLMGEADRKKQAADKAAHQERLFG
ncbi:hypothetical protein VVT58_00645 [Sphingobium sp. SJ10-10]|uniref:hypothetical protein n=1 Tax=unclassified Sphingobium TaxID=2611147 RepID=UPI000770655B|nr:MULTISPECIES: hypothetical protein [Sphingomonadaceae]AMK24328.1 hypothetical protein K426_16980 [Sphingobium sp. TKS]MEC6698112.1 hypothetical protein [Sphingobium sp. SJ10-10]NML90401.1 hypothetical protein [Sphingobium sp. TB-6]